MKKILIILIGICLISCNDRLDCKLIVTHIDQYSNKSYKFTIKSVDSNSHYLEEYNYYNNYKEFNIGDTLKLVKR